MTEDTRQDPPAPAADVEDIELTDEQADEVRGGKTPSPPGPQPIPYPN